MGAQDVLLVTYMVVGMGHSAAGSRFYSTGGAKLRGAG